MVTLFSYWVLTGRASSQSRSWVAWGLGQAGQVALLDSWWAMGAAMGDECLQKDYGHYTAATAGRLRRRSAGDARPKIVQGAEGARTVAGGGLGQAGEGELDACPEPSNPYYTRSGNQQSRLFTRRDVCLSRALNPPSRIKCLAPLQLLVAVLPV